MYALLTKNLLEKGHHLVVFLVKINKKRNMDDLNIELCIACFILVNFVVDFAFKAISLHKKIFQSFFGSQSD